MEFSSSLIEKAVNEISRLPGIGRKTAVRLALQILRWEEDEAEALSEAIRRLRKEVRYCNECHNISDADVCGICGNPHRDDTLICVVQDIRDVMAIEATGQFQGKYHVLGGIISPMDGIGPGDLEIDSLIQRLKEGKTREIILALPPTMEGDTTNFYIFRKTKDLDITMTTLSRGVAVGDDLEYADELTLGRSLLQRIPYEQSLKQ
jgi:recombination protein RecR